MKKTTIFISVIFVSIFLPIFVNVSLFAINIREETREYNCVNFHDLKIEISEQILFTILNNGSTSMNGSFLNGISKSNEYTILKHTKTHLTILFIEFAQLDIKWYKKNDTQFYSILWESTGSNVLSDSFNMAVNGHWYGSGHVYDHPWPMEKWNTDLGPFITGEPVANTYGIWPQYYGGVQERYWLCSSGLAIYADFNIPLFVSTNYNQNDQLKLVAKYASPYQNNYNTPLRLKYTLIAAKGIKETHRSVIDNFFSKPIDIPSTDMFTKPIWSTWAQYKRDINTQSVKEFANDIIQYNFSASQIEIDDDWTPHYGDFDFDPSKFSDPKGLVTYLKQKGFKVSIWMHPFISPFSKTFWDLSSFLVGWFFNLPALVSWWNGLAGLLDMTDPDQREWFLEVLKNLQLKYGIDSFKFDAGDAKRLSIWNKCKTPLDNPNNYTKLFAQLCAESDTILRAQELRVATGVQDLPMFVRLQDKDSNWGTSNGIKTVIPHILNQGLLGYPFVLPDMIGGNAYGKSGSSYPDRELFIRWIQLNALMPAMQFSIVPWRYDQQVIEIAQKMCKLHEKYAPVIIKLARETVQSGSPICRPLWWISPKDETALTISTEFLLGNDILVAPVLDKGARTRDIYLPEGTWIDQGSNKTLSGSKWYYDYPTPLDVLPYFIRSV